MQALRKEHGVRLWPQLRLRLRSRYFSGTDRDRTATVRKKRNNRPENRTENNSNDK